MPPASFSIRPSFRGSREAPANSEPNREAPELAGAAHATMAAKLLRALNYTVSPSNFLIQRNAVIAVKLLRRLRRIAKSSGFPVHSGSRIPLSNPDIRGEPFRLLPVQSEAQHKSRLRRRQ